MKNIDCKRSECSRYRLRDGLLTLLFFFLLLGLGNLFVENSFHSEHAAYYGRIAVRCASYAILIVICIKYYGCRLSFHSRNLHPSDSSALISCALIGILLAIFMLGQEAIEVWFLAHFETNLAYAHWSFGQGYSPAWRNLNIEFLVEILAISLIAPLAEEFFFRGVLLNLLSAKYRMITSISILCIIFVAMHPKNPHIVATTVFSIILSLIYIQTGALGLCWIAHGTFNLTALAMENLLWRWFLRSPETIGLTGSWLIFYIAFMFSISGIGLLYYYCIKPVRSDNTGLNR